MGFLRGSTERVDLGDGYFAVLRELTTDEYAPLEDMLAQISMSEQGVSGSMNMAAYRRAMVAASLVEWNVDDDDDQVLPVGLESVGRLPIGAFETLSRAASKLNGSRSNREAAQFRDGRDGGAAGRQVGAA
jgi:hypothetical protein